MSNSDQTFSRKIQPVFILFIIVIFSCMLSCTNEKKSGATKEETTDQNTVNHNKETDPFRPGFHFTPPEKWMNDPNGLVFNDGIYHLFYQHYPDDIVWGPMHWGHATSPDLLHWKHEDIALYPDSLGYIFSGSAVMDHQNTSGLGSAENPPLVAIFTYHDAERTQADDHQTQGIAYSVDNGVSWQKYKANPVIKNSGKRDFRDPKVFWHKESAHWIMCLAVGDHIEFYRSKNLTEWNYLSEFGKDVGAHGGVWECPDLFRLNVHGTEESHWILLVSINPGGPNSGSATQYFIGDFDGKQFRSEQRHAKWIDHGADNYAGVTYNNTPDDRRIFIGWMSNWIYAQNTPTKNWRSAMTLPRELVLRQAGDSIFVASQLLPALDQLGEKTLAIPETSLNEKLSIDGKFNSSSISWSQSLDQEIKITLNNQQGESVSLAMQPEKNLIWFDRRGSGLTDFHQRFADKLHTMAYIPENRQVNIQVVIDRSSIEVFVDDGRWVMTEQVFPTSEYDQLHFESEDKAIINNLLIKNIPNTLPYE